MLKGLKIRYYKIKKSVDGLYKFIDDNWHDNRRQADCVAATKALGEIGSKKAIECLLELMSVTYPEKIRLTAISYLGVYNTQETMEYLMERFKSDGNYKIKLALLDVLMKLKADHIVEAIIEVMENFDSIEVCRECINKLIQINAEKATMALLKIGSNPLHKLQKEAMAAIVKIKNIDVDIYGGIENVPLAVLMAEKNTSEPTRISEPDSFKPDFDTIKTEFLDKFETIVFELTEEALSKKQTIDNEKITDKAINKTSDIIMSKYNISKPEMSEMVEKFIQ